MKLIFIQIYKICGVYEYPHDQEYSFFSNDSLDVKIIGAEKAKNDISHLFIDPQKKYKEASPKKQDAIDLRYQSFFNQLTSNAGLCITVSHDLNKFSDMTKYKENDIFQYDKLPHKEEANQALSLVQLAFSNTRPVRLSNEFQLLNEGFFVGNKEKSVIQKMTPVKVSDSGPMRRITQEELSEISNLFQSIQKKTNGDEIILELLSKATASYTHGRLQKSVIMLYIHRCNEYLM